MKHILPLSLALLLCACSPSPTSTVNNAPNDPTLLSGTHTVVLNTTKGDITLKLYADKAPKTVTNFITHAKNGYYNGLTFHRVIKDFMIQGGDPTGTGAGGESIWGADFEDEISDLKNVRGAISMANRGPNTNGSQFFIIHANATPWLDGKHAVFGKIVEGMDVLDAIATAETGAGDRPIEEMTFSAEVIE